MKFLFSAVLAGSAAANYLNHSVTDSALNHTVAEIARNHTIIDSARCVWSSVSMSEPATNINSAMN